MPEQQELHAGASRPSIGLRTWIVPPRSWLPITVYLLLAALAVALDPAWRLDPVWALPLLNLTCGTVAGGVIAVIAAAAYLGGGTLATLALGTGMLAVASGFVLAGAFAPALGPEWIVPMHNGAMLLAGIALVSAGGWALAPPRGQLPGTRRQQVGFAYSMILCLLGGFGALIVTRRLPPFFIQGQGPTELRQVVLGLAVGAFLAAGVLFWQAYTVSRFRFFRWCAVGLLLIAVGLAVLLQQRSLGALVNWAGRWGQYLGSLYLMAGLLLAWREARQRRISLADLLATALSPASALQTALEDLPAVVWIAHDPACRHISGNRAAQALLRLAAGVDASKTGVDTAHLAHFRIQQNGRDLAADELPIQRVVATGAPLFDYPIDIAFADGTARSLVGNVIPLRALNGSLAGAIATFLDVTARKQVEAALRESERRLAADLDAMTRLQALGTLFVQEGNLDVVLGAVVEAAMALSGADFGNIQLLAADSGELRIVAQRNFPEWWLDFWNQVTAGQGACGTAIARGERVVVEDVEASPIFIGTPALDIQRRAGVRAVQSTPLVSRSGRPLGMFSTHYKAPHRPDERVLRLLDLLARQASDIIERAQSDKALQQLNATLEQRVQERTADLQRLTGELAVAEQRERQRLSELLHDGLQQLLVGARLQVEMFSRIVPDPARLTDHCNAVQALLAQALTDCRALSAELSPPILRQAGLLPALQWLARWMQDTHHLRVELTTDATAEPGDEAQKILLFQAVRELLFNTVKHAGVHQASVEVARRDGQVQIIVTDRGAGFDPAQIPPSGRGTLGLATIRQRLNYLGGSLEIESAPGRGSRFTLRVPLQEAGREQALTPAGPRLVSRPAVISGGRTFRLLVVDDHAVFRQSLARMLSQGPDLEVVGEAPDGKVAVDLAQQLQPDLVLMDISMPVMDGIEATRIIHTEFPQIQVIGLSMFVDMEQAKAMQAAGAAEYLTKSSPTESLLTAIRACKGRNRTE